jgi:hypothetical protein
VRPIGTPIALAIATRAVAMTELLTGLSVAPMSSGVTNRGLNGRRRHGSSPPGCSARAAA